MRDSKPPGDSQEQQDKKWYDRTSYQILLFVGGIALFGLVLGLILDWYIDPQNSTQKKDLVQALGLLTAGVAGAVGIFFTWRGQRITQESLQDTRENSEENLRLAREGQITERFTRAIDQLGAIDDDGNKMLELRLGGIYALERIAADSLAMENAPGRDYSTVMEVLTAYVRENSPSNEATTKADEGEKQHAPPEPRRPTADIRAILDVLNRTQNRVPDEYRTRLDLHEANLQGASLQEADLQEANLYLANLQEANLYGASLQGANLYLANLQEADLYGAFLQEADLYGAFLRGTILQGANLQGANLQEANLQEADLQEANLQGANLREAKVTYEQLADTVSLQDATMPDGSEHT